jgi:DnaJ-class molecular chaperone
MEERMKCPKCDGCGKVADTDNEEPWTAWLDLPLRSSIAVVAGIVRPKTCPDCNGSGQSSAS